MFKELFIKYKVIDYMTTTFSISKDEFVNSLEKVVEEGSIDMFSDLSDALSSDKREFRGEVNPHGFKIKRKKKFFDTSANMAIAYGEFIEREGQLIIETEIRGFLNFFKFLIPVFLAFYFFIFFLIITSKDTPLFVVAFLCFHMTIMFLIPFFISRRSVKKLKYELEREFYFLTKE